MCVSEYVCVQHTTQVLIQVLIWQDEGFHRPADHDDVTESWSEPSQNCDGSSFITGTKKEEEERQMSQAGV